VNKNKKKCELNDLYKKYKVLFLKLNVKVKIKSTCTNTKNVIW